MAHCRPQVFCHQCCATVVVWCTAVNGTLLTSGVTNAVPLWRCTAVNLFSGTLLTSGVLSPVGGGDTISVHCLVCFSYHPCSESHTQLIRFADWKPVSCERFTIMKNETTLAFIAIKSFLPLPTPGELATRTTPLLVGGITSHTKTIFMGTINVGDSSSAGGTLIRGLLHCVNCTCN